MATIKFRDEKGDMVVKKIPGFGFIDCTETAGEVVRMSKYFWSCPNCGLRFPMVLPNVSNLEIKEHKKKCVTFTMSHTGTAAGGGK